MKKYLVSFDLDTKEDRSADYNKVRDSLLGMGEVCKPLSNVYILVSSTIDAVGIRNSLQSFLKASDFILVVELSGVYASFNYVSVNETIKLIMNK